MSTLLTKVRKHIDKCGFREVRVDGKRVHETGFRDDAMGTSVPLRSVMAGSLPGPIRDENRGVDGPISVETSYSSGQVRVRFYEAVALLRVWDLPENLTKPAWRQFKIEFGHLLGATLDSQALDRQQWIDAARSTN